MRSCLACPQPTLAVRCRQSYSRPSTHPLDEGNSTARVTPKKEISWLCGQPGDQAATCLQKGIDSLSFQAGRGWHRPLQPSGVCTGPRHQGQIAQLLESPSGRNFSARMVLARWKKYSLMSSLASPLAMLPKLRKKPNPQDWHHQRSSGVRFERPMAHGPLRSGWSRHMCRGAHLNHHSPAETGNWSVSTFLPQPSPQHPQHPYPSDGPEGSQDVRSGSSWHNTGGTGLFSARILREEELTRLQKLLSHHFSYCFYACKFGEALTSPLSPTPDAFLATHWATCHRLQAAVQLLQCLPVQSQAKGSSLSAPLPLFSWLYLLQSRSPAAFMGPSLPLIGKAVTGAVLVLGLILGVRHPGAIQAWILLGHKAARSVTTAAHVMNLLGLSSVLLLP